MDVMLQNSEKPTGLVARGAGMGVSFSIDVSKLHACFGGFSPMALSDGNATQEQIAAAEERARALREQLMRAAAIEAARASELRRWIDSEGTVWSYVVLDGRNVRIERCETSCVFLRIPAEIEGMPVVALAADACSHLASVEEVVCPESLLTVGCSAFRFNKNLRCIEFPPLLSQFDSNWLYGCARLEYLKLPGELPKIDSSVFDLPSLRVLAIGPGLGAIAPGAFAKSKLERVEIDPGNPFVMTDGRGIYTKDGSILMTLAVPGERYRILEGCKAIAKKGLSTFSCLREVDVPDSLEVIGEFAFSRTAIAAFEAPKNLKHILEKAFFNCAQLEHVHLREGLLSVASHAFTGTRIAELRLPATVCELGYPIADRTSLTYAGADATFSIAEGCEHFEFDAAGVLYRKTDEGVHLLRMIDPEVTSYAVKEGTLSIDPAACDNHPHLAEIAFPPGLREIGQGAFKGCRSLRRADIPEGVRRIEGDAFLDTALERVRIPSSLEHLGARALVTYGAHHGDVPPSLREIEVGEENPRFYTVPGLLLERKDDGSARVVLCSGDVEVVRIPAEVNEVAPYALNGIQGIRELYLSDRIADVGIRGLAVDGLLDRIFIDLVDPIEGHDSFDVRFPHTDRGAQQQMLALSMPNHVSVETLLEHYDNAIVNASSFDAKSRKGLSLYEQVTRIIARLQDPVFMTSVNRSLSDRVLSSGIEKICVSVAKRDDRATIDALFDLGYLNADNLLAVIDRVSEVQDASVTGYLLEMKRMHFGCSYTDFDL